MGKGFVVENTNTGNKYSNNPMPYPKALKQIRALYINMKREKK